MFVSQGVFAVERENNGLAFPRPVPDFTGMLLHKPEL
jgi:hypothetical protein